MRARGIDPKSHIPFNFIFKGLLSGSLWYRSLHKARLIIDLKTKKITTAQKMGQVFYDISLLSAPEYLERSASDLVTPYVSIWARVGHTGTCGSRG
jgi:hypothetical protein